MPSEIFDLEDKRFVKSNSEIINRYLRAKLNFTFKKDEKNYMEFEQVAEEVEGNEETRTTLDKILKRKKRRFYY
jgi:hypothetical protein